MSMVVVSWRSYLLARIPTLTVLSVHNSTPANLYVFVPKLGWLFGLFFALRRKAFLFLLLFVCVFGR